MGNACICLIPNNENRTSTHNNMNTQKKSLDKYRKFLFHNILAETQMNPERLKSNSNEPVILEIDKAYIYKATI